MKNEIRQKNPCKWMFYYYYYYLKQNSLKSTEQNYIGQQEETLSRATTAETITGRVSATKQPEKIERDAH